MYCSGCGSPIAPGLSFCNRCGTSLKERSETKQTGAIGALVTAMTLIAICGIGILLGGPIALKREGQFGEELVVLFMFLTFFIVVVMEIFLYRQLGRITKAGETKQLFPPPLQSAIQQEYREPVARALAEPGSSVTENTTRTLEHAREKQFR
jgi:predicted nucleic acid-binding Zn ribbon protein